MRTRALVVLGLVALGACAGILGLRPRPDRAFPHRSHTRAGISCLTCHTAAATAGDDTAVTAPDAAQCVTCHQRPHDPRPCLGCHSDAWIAGAAVDARRHLRFSHAEHLSAVQGSCVRCHTDVSRADAPIRPRMAACLGCHEHKDQFDPDRCDTCHVDLETEGTLPESHLVHDGDWIREHGVRAASASAMCSSCHTEQACARCHGVTAPRVPAQLHFDIPDGQALHRAGFRSHHAEEARADPGACSACHDDGACRDCHQGAGVAAAAPGATLSPHPAGWVGLDNDHGPAARRDPAACASCHGGAGEQLCVDCHRVGGVGGSPHPPGWASNQPRSALPCRLCHQ